MRFMKENMVAFALLDVFPNNFWAVEAFVEVQRQVVTSAANLIACRQKTLA
jgi:hypothetical protein